MKACAKMDDHCPCVWAPNPQPCCRCERDVPCDEETAYELLDIAKSFSADPARIRTALTLLRLVAEGTFLLERWNRERRQWWSIEPEGVHEAIEAAEKERA